jgi:hypothetical protein
METHHQLRRATHFWHEPGGQGRFRDLHGLQFSLSLLARIPELRRALMAPHPSIRLAVAGTGALLQFLDAIQTYEHIKLARGLDEYTP